MTRDGAGALAERVRAALAVELGGPTFPNQAGWTRVEAGTWQLENDWIAAVHLVKDAAPLTFWIYPTRPEKPAYARTPRYDICYFLGDVEADAQQRLYEEHKPSIDAFCAWLAGWDGRQEPNA